MSYERRYAPIGTQFSPANPYTITGTWDFTTIPTATGQWSFLYHGGALYTSGKVTVSSSTPSGGTSGDIWLQVT